MFCAIRSMRKISVQGFVNEIPLCFKKTAFNVFTIKMPFGDTPIVSECF